MKFYITDYSAELTKTIIEENSLLFNHSIVFLLLKFHFIKNLQLL